MGSAAYRLYRVWELFEEKGYDDLIFTNYRLERHGIYASSDDARRGADELRLDEPMFRERVAVRIGDTLFLLDDEFNGVCRLADMNRENGTQLTVISFGADNTFALCMAWELYTCSDDDTLLSNVIPGFESHGVYASFINARRDAQVLALEEHRIRDRALVVPDSTPFLLDPAHHSPVSVRRPRRRQR